jgi:hypothetical protein
MPDLWPYPIVVGVTGHRDLASDAQEGVSAAVHAVLEGLQAEFGDALHVMTALADGADQLVADEAEKLDLKTIAVSPMPLATYRVTVAVANRDRLDHHWDRAVLKLELPELCDPATPGYAERHYGQLGALLARRCHLLLALWDGLPAAAAQGGAPKHGGTADVVRMRQHGEFDFEGFRSSPLFVRAGSRLDLSPGGPILQVVTPQAATGGAVAVLNDRDARAGNCFLLPPPDAPAGASPRAVKPGEVYAELGRPWCPTPKGPETVDRAKHDFDQIIRLNRQITRFGKVERGVLQDQLGYLHVKGVDDPGGLAGELLERLRCWQAAADTAAQSFQRRLLGVWGPAAPFRARLYTGWRYARRHWRVPPLGVLFGFAAVVPAAVAAFEIYAHLDYTWGLFVYLALLLGSVLYYHSRVRRHQWQNRFQDYRALAEAMRVQVFWGLAATPVAAADNYLRKQSGELGWIQFALRGPALWAAALALAMGTPNREMVTKGWIKDQRDFFGKDENSGKAADNKRAARNSTRLFRAFLFGGVGVSLLLAVLEIVWLAAGRNSVWHQLYEVKHLLVVIAATAPALAAFFAISAEKRAYEAHFHSYTLMGAIFSRALREAKAVAPGNDKEFQDLVRDLGREALAENAEWLLDHRHRPIEHQ